MSLGECFPCKDPVCEHVMKMLGVREARIAKAEKQLEIAREGLEWYASREYPSVAKDTLAKIEAVR